MTVLEELERMSDERFHALYEALSEHGFGPLDGEIARELKFRPKSIKKLPLETRSKRARRILVQKKSEELAYEFFGQYLVRTKKELVTSFLDGTGVPHEEGMIEDLDGTQPDESKLASTVKDLDDRFDPTDVTLYLALCTEMWPDSEALESLWNTRAPKGA